MIITKITSDANNTVKTIRSLQRRQSREKEQLFLLEGIHCLTEALQKNLELKTVVVSATYLDEHVDELHILDVDQISVVEDKIFNELSTTSSSCGVLAVAEMLPQDRSTLASWRPRLIAVADAIQDPGNLGTLIRTAYAAQFGGLLILKGSVDLYNPKVVRAASGALFALPILSDLEPHEAVELLRASGIKIVLCQAGEHKRYFEADLADSAAIVLGNEGQGINADLKAAADESISIPMNPQSESLNVAISGGIILFETLKQRLQLQTDR